MFNTRSRFTALTVALALFAGSAAAVHASNYPERPVKIVVGYSAGGTTDVIARIVANGLSETLNQSFVVENRAGANSNIGTGQVAVAPADGYTLLVTTISNTTNATLYESLPFDIQTDFAPIGSIGMVPNVLVVPATSSIRSYEDYVNFAKENPGRLTFASAGIGSSIHLSGELFKYRLKLDMLHVPYKGSGPALTDLIGGQTDSMFDNLPSSLPHIRSAKLRAVAVTSPERANQLPDIPTVSELGLEGFEAYSWTGLSAPAGTPEEVITTLNAALERVLKNPDTKEQLYNLGVTTRISSPQEFKRFIETEVEKWAIVVRESGASAK
jgi:tripartite-type tricarboxylate transporter receptor subunit TctC